MRPTDQFRTAAGGLWRQKGRAALTLAGVAVGACLLLFSLSLGIGLRELIDREFKGRDGFWQIAVYPGRYQPTLKEEDVPAERTAVGGDLAPDRAARLRRTLAKRYIDSRPHRPATALTRDALARIAALPDVQEVRTFREFYNARTWVGDRSTLAVVGAGKLDLPAVTDRLAAGRLPATDAEAVVSEFALYDLGARTEADFAAVGKPVRVELTAGGVTRSASLAGLIAGRNTDQLTRTQTAALDRVIDRLPDLVAGLPDLSPEEKLALRPLVARRATPEPADEPAWRSGKTAAREFTVVGVLREAAADGTAGDAFRRTIGYARAGVLLTPAGGDALLAGLPGGGDGGLTDAEVRVRPGGDLPAVVAAVEGMGYDSYSAVKWFNNARLQVTMIAAGLNVFALAALLVAALGITNTMVTSVVERTKEIGVFKALGARDGQVLRLFLTEGAVLGLLGGLLGVAAARLSAGPADGFVRHQVEQQGRGEKLLTESVFDFPLWLTAATVGFAVLVTTLAALYPARRAARVHPVEALRHE